ncbi:MAG: hypothetical protein ABIH03_16205 [Pseudomonadota bacterium]
MPTIGPEAPKFGGKAIKRDPQGNVVPDDDPVAAAYAELERRETEEIVRGLRGEEVGSLIYNIPHGANPEKNPDAIIDCGHEGCPYAAKHKPHVHVVGINVGGIDEVSRIYEGIQVWAEEPSRIHRDGRYYWRCRAVALDTITGTMKPAFAEQPEGAFDSNRSGDDMRSTFPPRIAERKAKRNAVQEILPQPLLNKIRQMGREGKKSFEPAEAERLIASLGISRRNRPPRYLMNPITGEIAVALSSEARVLASGSRPSAPMSLPTPDEPTEEWPQAKSTEEAPAPPRETPARASTPPRSEPAPQKQGGGRCASEKQRKMLFAISKEKNVPQDVLKAYMQEEFGITSTDQLQMRDVDAVKQWLEGFGVPAQPQTDDDFGDDVPF